MVVHFATLGICTSPACSLDSSSLHLVGPLLFFVFSSLIGLKRIMFRSIFQKVFRIFVIISLSFSLPLPPLSLCVSVSPSPQLSCSLPLCLSLSLFVSLSLSLSLSFSFSYFSFVFWFMRFTARLWTTIGTFCVLEATPMRMAMSRPTFPQSYKQKM